MTGLAVADVRVTEPDENGITFTITRCQDCRRELRLQNVAENDEHGVKAHPVLAPPPRALMLAAMMVCNGCTVKADAARERHEAEKSVGMRAAKSVFPNELRRLRFEDMILSGKREHAVEVAKVWAHAPAKEARGLILYGPVGTGKTRLAATAAWTRVVMHEPVTWVSLAVLVAQLSMDFSELERKMALKVLSGRGALVLDDFDKVKPSEKVVEQLFAAIDRRVQSGAPVLVTTNLRPRELEEKFGEAITSRLIGYALGRAVELDGADRRLQLGEEG